MPADRATVLYLIRHGETAWNVEEVFRGRADVPLDERGQAQAQAIARALADEPIAAVYTSPLRRAVATAQPVAEARGLDARVDERLIDVNVGAWEGKPLGEVRRTWPELYARWEKKPTAMVFPDGESLAAVRERAARAIAEAASRHPGQAVAIVSHRVVVKVALCAVLGLDDSHFWQIRQDTGCINRIEIPAGKEASTGGVDFRQWVITSLNDLCHLRDLRHKQARDF
jgi:alpha-ribazole phosphatase